MRLLRRKEGCMILSRRRYMGGTNMDKYLIKTVTLDSAHESDSIGNPVYWSQFLELPLVSDSSDRNLYMVVFEGNQASVNYRTDFEVFYRDSSSIICLDVRNNRSNLNDKYLTNRSSWASVGTVIKVYKITAV